MQSEPTSTASRSARRGIYLVANRVSESLCRNLIYTIRRNGCLLPIRVIPYGGEPARLDRDSGDIRHVELTDFPVEGQEFLQQLKSRLPNCSTGLLRRYLAWFGEFDEFLYSDNDVVALMNWDELFSYLQTSELVHADTEYLTNGAFNFHHPELFEQMMGIGNLQKAVTAGHFLCRKDARQLESLLQAANWMNENREIVKSHDQTLMHIAIVLGKWNVLNLCKPPHSWASSWAGDHRDTFELISTIQARGQRISHIHYSGGEPSGAAAIDELLYASDSPVGRKRKLLTALFSERSGLNRLKRYVKHARRK